MSEAATTDTTVQATTPDTTAAPAAGSALSVGAGAAPSANADEWVQAIPEKYRVTKDDGTLDPAASVPKLAQAYKELVQKMVAGESPPADADAYDVKELPHGLRFEDLKKDEKLAGWLKGAHAKGMSNAQVQHVFEGLAEYMVAEQSFTAEEAIAELRQVWTTEADFAQNAQRAWRAAGVIAPRIGLSQADFDRQYGNDPVIVRLMAAFGAEMAEDRNVGAGDTPNPGDFDTQVAAIDKQLEEMIPSDPRRSQLVERKLALFQSKFGGKSAAAFTGPMRAA